MGTGAEHETTAVLVANQATAGARLFEAPVDYGAFLDLLGELAGRDAITVLAWALLPAEWLLLVTGPEPASSDRLAVNLAVAHSRRFHAARGTGGGRLYPSAGRACPVCGAAAVALAAAYVELAPQRAGLSAGSPWPYASRASTQSLAAPLAERLASSLAQGLPFTT